MGANKKLGITGSTLKIIAIITMLIDHIGAAILERLLVSWKFNMAEATGQQLAIYYLNFAFRTIGRIAFPIFCFCLVEGFLYTKNVKKYAKRLLLFGIISEIPFDLAFFQMPTLVYQNVYFTLWIGLLTLIGIQWVEKKESFFQSVWIGVPFFVKGGIIFSGIWFAEYLKTDYGGIGVVLILIFYFFKDARIKQSIVGAMSFLWEPASIAAFCLLPFYNGERGIRFKYIFYVFYPLHLCILYFIEKLLIG